jgi:gamma-glutamyltranspeptidase/glutathione hydrolase
MNIKNLLILITIFLLVLPQIFVNYVFGSPELQKKPSNFKFGVVASAHPLASKVGLEILQNGGNAIDAAVATAFALGVVEPYASGIGGGGFMLIYLAKTGEVVTIDYREQAPGRANAKMFQRLGPAKLKMGYSSVAVPGTVAGLTLALEKYGTMELPHLLNPAIQLAEKGFPVTPLLSGMIANNASKLSKFPASAKIFLKHGRPFKVGEQLYQKDLAETYRLISEHGPEVFYQGTIASSIADAMKLSGTGLITLADLEDYKAFIKPPVKGTYRGYEIISMGPPSSGGTHIIQLLNILEGFDFGHISLNSPKSIAIMAEAMKKVFSDRAKFMGDANFIQIPLEMLLSKEYADKLRKTIKISYLYHKTKTSDYLLSESIQTTHLSVADKEGNLIALTQSIDDFFGSGVVVPGTGILLNNAMRDFDPQPGRPNSIAPGKRPLSSMSPTLVLKDGKSILSLGIPGATRIISVLPQILMNIVDHHMTLQEAFDAPRIHSVTKTIYLESRIPGKTRAALTRLGYPLVVKKGFDLYFGGAQGVAVDQKTGLLSGAADPRREGAVSGY